MRLNERVLYVATEKPTSKSASLISGAEARWQLYDNRFSGPSVMHLLLSRRDEITHAVHYKDIQSMENYWHHISDWNVYSSPKTVTWIINPRARMRYIHAKHKIPRPPLRVIAMWQANDELSSLRNLRNLTAYRASPSPLSESVSFMAPSVALQLNHVARWLMSSCHFLI